MVGGELWAWALGIERLALWMVIPYLLLFTACPTREALGPAELQPKRPRRGRRGGGGGGAQLPVTAEGTSGLLPTSGDQSPQRMQALARGYF